MKKIIIFLIFTSLLASGFAQVHGKISDVNGNPVGGVTISWLSGSQRVTSDHNGDFSIQNDTAATKLIVSGRNYRPDTVTVVDRTIPVNITLTNQVNLSEVSVVSKNLGIVKSRTAVIQTEKITRPELTKAACCNLSESFETNPSVDVAYSDAATGAKQIKLLGLSGAYVQMLTENIPSLRGISSAYGLGFIPGPWMESIQVSKGTASVVNGYEAITGQINVEYKKPQTSEIVAANLYANDAGRVEANVTASAKLSDYLSTGVMLHASNELTKLDDNHDDFMDMPMIKQYNFSNRWFYRKNNYVSQAFIRALSEHRTGGQIDGHYKIDIDTKRYEFFLKNGYIFNVQKGTSVGFIVSGSLHDQDAVYGLKTYNGHQGNLYANLIFQTSFTDKHKLSTGASVNMDNYDENLQVSQANNFKRREYVSGIFAEYTYNLNDKFIALAGLRADYNSHYGTFVTPRLHLKYNITDFLHLRASAGKGYRSPNVLAENNFLLASNRSILIDPNLKMEDAWNYGLSAQAFILIGTKELNLTAEWYYTDFNHQVVVDMDSDPHAAHFSNLNGKSYAQSLQFEASMKITRGLSATVAHRITDAQSTIAGVLREKPLTSRSKSLITASYQTPLKKWQFDFTVQFNGGGRLPDPVSQNPLWEKKFKPFTMLNTQITKYFKTWSVYLGSENLTNFVQKNPIVDVQNPFGTNFDGSMVWGPMHGRSLYVGFRWALEGD